MKFFNKMISAVAAVAMLASMAVMPAVHADSPTLKLSAAPNAAEGYVDLTVSYTGAVDKMCGSGIIVNIGTGFAVSAADKAIIDSDYEGLPWDALADEALEGWSTAKSGLDGANLKFEEELFKFATLTQAATSTKKTLDASCDNLFTVRLYATTDSVWTDGYEFTLGDSALSDTYESKQGTLTLDDEDAVIEGTGAGFKATGDDSAKDLAVGAIKEYAAGVSGTIDFKGTATLVGGGTKKFKKTVTVPTISGAAKVGLIVSFDGSVYTDFVID